MIGVGGVNQSLTDFYAGELAGRPRGKEAGAPLDRSKAKEGRGISQKAASYEPSRAGEASKAEKLSPLEQAGKTSEANEAKLSAKAKEYLKNLREANEDFDFFIANGDDETNGVLNSGSKEYAVAFSNEELEKMADNEEYAQKMLDGIGMAMDMADRVNEGLDLEGKGISFSRIDVSINDDGSMSIFAELEKAAEKQKEQIEAAKEQRAEERKAAAEEQKAALEEKRGASPIDRKRMNAYGGPKKPAQGIKAEDAAPGAGEILRTKISADSEEDLFDKVAHVNWDEVAADQKKQQEAVHFESVV